MEKWKVEFEKKHWGAMFEDGDYNALLADIETEIITKLIEDIPEKTDRNMLYLGNFDVKQQLRAKWLSK